MKSRTLRLHREALTELTTVELAGLAAGAVPTPTPVVNTLPINDCIAVGSVQCATRLDCLPPITDQPRCF